MITIIAGTNRLKSNSELVARHISNFLNQEGQDNQILLLKDLPREFAFSDLYGERTAQFQDLAEKFIIPVEKLIFVIPEYNGGFPGVLKTFIDGLSPSWLYYKKAALVGLSSGKAGSLRAMDQFTNVLHYLRMNVHYHKPKLSSIEESISDRGEIIDERSLSELIKISKEVIEF